MRALSLTLLFLMSVAAHADALKINPDVVSGLEKAIDGGKIRAAVVGLYDNGKTKVTGFSQMSRADDSAPQGNSIFEIGSISKVFTAILTQTQVNAGRLGWDDTIVSRCHHSGDSRWTNSFSRSSTHNCTLNAMTTA